MILGWRIEKRSLNDKRCISMAAQKRAVIFIVHYENYY